MQIRQFSKSHTFIHLNLNDCVEGFRKDPQESQSLIICLSSESHFNKEKSIVISYNQYVLNKFVISRLMIADVTF